MVAGNPAWQLLAVTGVVPFRCHFPSVHYRPCAPEARTSCLLALCRRDGCSKHIICFILAGDYLVAIVIAWVAPLTFDRHWAASLYFWLSLFLSTIATAFLFWLNTISRFARLSNNNPAGFAAFILLASTIALYILATIASVFCIIELCRAGWLFRSYSSLLFPSCS